jgi:hypothetical protein
MNQGRKLGHELANKLGMYEAFESPLSPSHIDADYQLGMAILTKTPLANPRLELYPNPSFELRLAMGAWQLTILKVSRLVCTRAWWSRIRIVCRL